MTDKREIRVVDNDTGETIDTVDVSGKSDRDVERVMRGMIMQMDTERFHAADSADDGDDPEPAAPGM